MAKSEKAFQRELDREAENFDKLRRRASTQGHVSSEPVVYDDPSSEPMAEEIVAPDVKPDQAPGIMELLKTLNIEAPTIGGGAPPATLGALSGGMDDLNTNNSSIANVAGDLLSNDRNALLIQKIGELAEQERKRKMEEEATYQRMWGGESKPVNTSFSEGL